MKMIRWILSPAEAKHSMCMTFKTVFFSPFGSRARGLHQTLCHQIFKNSTDGAFADNQSCIPFEKNRNFGFSMGGIFSERPENAQSSSKRFWLTKREKNALG